MIHPSYQFWLDNDKPVVYCKCGCGGEIIPKPDWKWHGVPKYISGHNMRAEPYHGMFVKGNLVNKGRKQSKETILKRAKSNRGQHRFEKQKRKISDNHADFSGDKHPRWKGGYKLKCGRNNASRRGLGHICLNDCSIDGWVGHHLDWDYVMFILEELHKSVYHSVTKDKNMDEVNFYVLNYLFLIYGKEKL